MTDFSADKLAAFFSEASRYFANRPIHGEDAAHWSNVYNAENCQKASAAILAMAEREKRMREALEDLQGDGSATGTWMEAVEPLVARFNVAAQFGADAVHNATGAKAIADLMHSMADRLDRACVIARRALGEEKS